MHLGADPELFVTMDGKVVPASEAGFPNGKTDRRKRFQLSDNVQLYRDGYAAEVNFTRAFTCRGVMGNALRNGISAFLNRNTNMEKKLGFIALPSVPVNIEDLPKLPSDVSAFGCSPSLNAWTGPGEMDVEGLTHPFRYAGGHLWFSDLKSMWWTKNIIPTVKLLDQFLGVPLTYLFDRPEQYQRRKLYGKAGEFRTKTFFNGDFMGLEYRVPGPEWVNHAAFFSFATGVGRAILENADILWKKHGPLVEERGPQIQSAINEGVDLDQHLNGLSLQPFYNGKLLDKIRNKSLLGQKRFEFRLLETHDFHDGWDYARQNLERPKKTKVVSA